MPCIRLSTMLSLLAGPALLASALPGCGGDDTAPEPEPEPEPEPTDTAGGPDSTAPDLGYIDAAYWIVTARFAIDGAEGQALSYGDRVAGVQPISFTVTLLSADALTLGLTPETSCSATFEMDGPLSSAEWAVANGGYLGFDLPLDGDVRDECAFASLPPEFLGELAPHVRNWSWGLGLAPLAREVEDGLRNSLAASEWDALAPYIVGGAISGSIFGTDEGGAPSYLNVGFSLAYEVDASFVLAENALGDPVPVASEQVWDGTTVGTGYYEIQVGFFDQPSLLTMGATQ